MGSTTTETTIANRALQLLGYEPIGSINENSRGARAIKRAYQPVFESELRKYNWVFAVKRIALSQDAVGPAFGKANYFTLPGDFVDWCPPDDTERPVRDWTIEGNKIATNDCAPLNLRYISSAITPALFDPCFSEAFSAALATSVCEELTQSNSKLTAVATVYDNQIEIAKKRNAINKRPIRPAVDPFISARF